MSQENMEVIKRAGEAFNEGGPEAARRFFAEDAEFHEAPESPSPRVGRGIEEVGRLFGAFEETWAEHRTEIEEIRAVGDDRVLVFSIERKGRDGTHGPRRCCVHAPQGKDHSLADLLGQAAGPRSRRVVGIGWSRPLPALG
jgi:hypothetical protein